MFCSQCGTKATGNFCHQCGARLARAEQSESPLISDALNSEPSTAETLDPLCVPAELVVVHWTEETNYQALLEHEEVRQRIAAAAKSYQPAISAEELLKVYDAVASPPVSLEKLGKALMPVYDKLGIRTGKSAEHVYRLSPGRVLVALLCSLARRGLAINHVEQGPDGCLLNCTVPSTIWSFAGELMVSVERVGQQTHVKAAVKLPGQLYDWGKSRWLLDQLLAETHAFAA